MLFAFLLTGANAQDIVYTQFEHAPQYHNPALTGIEAGLHTCSLGRLQGMDTPWKVGSFSFSGDWGQRKVPFLGGVGLFMNGSSQGEYLHTLQAGISLAARFSFGSSVALQAGMKASVMHRKMDWDELNWSSFYDPKYGIIIPTGFDGPDRDDVTVADFGFGLAARFGRNGGWFRNTTGVAADHLFEPDVSFLTGTKSAYPRTWIAHTTFELSTGERSTSSLKFPGFADPLVISPGIVYLDQWKTGILRAGVDLVKMNITLGIWYRDVLNDASPEKVTSIRIGYRVPFRKDSFARIMYSIDLTDRDISGSSVFAHELALLLSIGSLER